MWAWVLASVAWAATVHVDADRRVEVQVGEEHADVKPSKTMDLNRVDAGTVRIQVLDGGVAVWAGDLTLPDKAEVWLAWRDGTMSLVGVDREKSGLEKAGNTMMTVGATAQAASDVADAASAAGRDMEAAQRGEATGSSHTEIEVTGGPGGLQTRTERTTAGEGGVHGEATSTSVGPDGVSRTTSEVSASADGIYGEETERSVSRLALPGRGGLVVTLVQVDIGAPPGAGRVEPAAEPSVAEADAAPPPPAIPDAKEVFFGEPPVLDADGSSWALLDPVAEAELFKVQIRAQAPEDRALVWEPDTARATLNHHEVEGRGRSAVASPGEQVRRVVVFEKPDAELRCFTASLDLGRASLLARGTAVGLGTMEATDGAEARGGDVTCTLRNASVSKKGSGVTLDCANGGEGWIWVSPAAAAISLGDGAPVANQDAKLAPFVIAPDSSEKVSIEIAEGSKSGDVQVLAHLDGVFHVADEAPLDLPSIGLELDPERTGN